jgi:hypothetical protein
VFLAALACVGESEWMERRSQLGGVESRREVGGARYEGGAWSI